MISTRHWSEKRRQHVDLYMKNSAQKTGIPRIDECFPAVSLKHHRLPTKLSTSSVDERRADKGLPSTASGAIIAPHLHSLSPTLFSIIQAAGWPIWPLIICSIVALALVIERIVSLQGSKIVPPKLLDEVLTVTRSGLPPPDVIGKLAANSLLGSVLASGMRAAQNNPRIDHDGLQFAFEAAGKVAVHHLERYLNTLGTIASAAPLLGLLGTVVGMIEIFGSQAPGGGNPEQLAHGISIALYNTAFGLIVAIPTLMLYRYFRGRVDEYTVELEQAAHQLLPHLERLRSHR